MAGKAGLGLENPEEAVNASKLAFSVLVRSARPQGKASDSHIQPITLLLRADQLGPPRAEEEEPGNGEHDKGKYGHVDPICMQAVHGVAIRLRGVIVGQDTCCLSMSNGSSVSRKEPNLP